MGLEEQTALAQIARTAETAEKREAGLSLQYSSLTRNASEDRWISRCLCLP